jgi:hypothetical protein
MVPLARRGSVAHEKKDYIEETPASNRYQRFRKTGLSVSESLDCKPGFAAEIVTNCVMVILIVYGDSKNCAYSPLVGEWYD